MSERKGCLCPVTMRPEETKWAQVRLQPTFGQIDSNRASRLAMQQNEAGTAECEDARRWWRYASGH